MEPRVPVESGRACERALEEIVTGVAKEQVRWVDLAYPVSVGIKELINQAIGDVRAEFRSSIDREAKLRRSRLPDLIDVPGLVVFHKPRHLDVGGQASDVVADPPLNYLGWSAGSGPPGSSQTSGPGRKESV